MQKIKTYDTAINAEIAKGLLEQHKIPSIIEANDGGGALPYLAVEGAGLYVHEQNFEKAREILERQEQ